MNPESETSPFCLLLLQLPCSPAMNSMTTSARRPQCIAESGTLQSALEDSLMAQRVSSACQKPRWRRRVCCHSVGSPPTRISKVELRTDAAHPPRQDPIRLQPRPTRNEPGVVGQDGAGVQHVVEIDPDSRPRATEPQDLRDAKIELIEPIAVHRTGCDQIDGHVGHIPRRKP